MSFLPNASSSPIGYKKEMDEKINNNQKKLIFILENK